MTLLSVLGQKRRWSFMVTTKFTPMDTRKDYSNLQKRNDLGWLTLKHSDVHILNDEQKTYKHCFV